MTDKLKEKILETFGRELSTPKDFDELSNQIWQRTHKAVSPTTLKRLFGYINESVNPQKFTLDTLSQYVGASNYTSLLADNFTHEVESYFSINESLSYENIEVNKLLLLTWRPNRSCIILHKGNGVFEVKEVHNTKLAVGDTFECHLFIMNEPLFIDKLVHQGKPCIGFVAGKRHGILYEILE